MEIRAALAGNPNCGKTTMFNALTGANQYAGNWPGVTVEKKEGKVRTKESKEEKIKVTAISKTLNIPATYPLFHHKNSCDTFLRQMILHCAICSVHQQ